MGLPETDGPKNPYFPLSFVHGSHHIGEDNEPPMRRTITEIPTENFLK